MRSNNVVIRAESLIKNYKVFETPARRFLHLLFPFINTVKFVKHALRGISLEIYRGEVLGILGRNGSGKSTLLQVISGILPPDGGKVEVSGKVVPLLELGAGFDSELTGRQNAMMYSVLMRGSAFDERDIEKVRQFADIGEYFDLPIKLYSSGMFVRLAFAVAMELDPETLIVDEALSVGDVLFQYKCYERIKDLISRGRTIVFVSHSTDAVLRICTRAVVLNDGTLLFEGAPSDAVSIYHKMLFETASPTIAATPEGASAYDGADRVAFLANYNRHETRLGDRRVEIFDVVVSVDGKTYVDGVLSGARVRIDLSCHARTTCSNVSFGFAVTTREGVYVFGTNLHLMQAELVTAEAGETFVVRIEFDCYLVGDEYFLNLGCNQLNAENECFLDVRRGVLLFKVIHTPALRGVANLNPQILPRP